MNRVERRPAWWATSLTRGVLHVIPPGGARQRWQQELTSELYGLSRRAQARHTLGVVSRALSLRAAVKNRDRIIKEDVMSKPIRCRLHLHQFRVASTDDGARFLRCRRCGKEDPGLGAGHWAGSLGGGGSA